MNADAPSIDRGRLFVGSCLALVATSVAFATVGAVMLALKQQFVLTNLQVGWIGEKLQFDWGGRQNQHCSSP